ncbi:DUF309 domain-containing protein [Jannaschia sp. Os4]|uniref:DUF309 domain-containing protein n=1 Tax=Jannaschia sp. Os4 TaxID=2807617 RepID=UPI0031B56C4D
MPPPDPLDGWRPPHAYVPGRTARHPEGMFDHLKRTDGPPGSTLAWRAGLALMAEGYFWEAHEVWEALWLAQPPAGAEAVAVRAAIQAANAGLKARMGQGKAARRLAAIAADLRAEAARRGATLQVPGEISPEVMHHNAK